MKILIIEDNEHKLSEIIRYVEEYKHQYEVAKSYNAAKERLVQFTYDFIILDMTLPESDGEDELIPLAGNDILDMMKFKKIFISTVVLTGYDWFGRHDDKVTLNVLGENLKAQFSAFLKGIIFYSGSSEDWKNELKSIIGK
jgi:two-component SAPR family response regulator